MSKKFEVFTAEDFRIGQYALRIFDVLDESGHLADAVNAEVANIVNAILNERGKRVKGKHWSVLNGEYAYREPGPLEEIKYETEALLIGERKIDE